MPHDGSLPRAAGAVISLALTASLTAAAVPSSPRSREVAQRVTPSLETELGGKGLRLGSPVFMRIFKQSAELELWILGKERYELFKTYAICTFSGELGPKQKQGDLQAPEGFYSVPASQMVPTSSYHLSFNLGYPNAYDRSLKRTGSALMVHGSCVSIGCYAMTDEGIEEIWTVAAAALKGGQPAFDVHIFPFRMNDASMEAQRGSEWFDFWSNLREGHDRFEALGLPPRVSVRNKRYVFGERR